MRLVKTIGLTLLLAAGMQLCAAAKEQEAFYTGEKIKGYDKGSFVVLEADDINFRSAAEDGNVLKVLPHLRCCVLSAKAVTGWRPNRTVWTALSTRPIPLPEAGTS